jgi:hypothetical protein
VENNMTQRWISLVCLSAALGACATEIPSAEPREGAAGQAAVLPLEAERDAARAEAAEQAATPNEVGVSRQALTSSRLNVPVDRRHFGGNILVEDLYYTVGTLCAEDYERDRVESAKTSGNGFCEFVSWESPDNHDCRARIHVQTNAFWGGVWCETSVFEKLSERASCCEAQTTPGCDDSTLEYPNIEQCVCSRDSYCCSTAWDEYCAAEVVAFGCAPRNYCQ